jgi:outer membrane protein OmpA-like peptidoglycan-associated protein
MRRYWRMKSICFALAAAALVAAGDSAGQPSGITPQSPIGNTRPQVSSDAERWTSYRDFWFDFGSTRIDSSDTIKVADVASYMTRNPTHRLAIDGEIGAGDADMGERRIDSVREALIKAGVPPYKIYTGPYGDPRMRRDRRVEVLFGSRD